MIPAVGEGIRSAVLPCSLTLLLPAVAVVLAARRRPLAALTSFAGAASLLIWLRASGMLPVSTTSLRTSMLGIAAVAAMAAFLAKRFATLPGSAGLALVPGVMAGWIWQPCVGMVLGGVLDRAGSGSLLAFPELAVYTAGVLLPTGAIALLRVALGDTEAPRRTITLVGVTLGTGIGILVVSGLQQRVIGWLARVSV